MIKEQPTLIKKKIQKPVKAHPYKAVPVLRSDRDILPSANTKTDNSAEVIDELR